MNFGDALVALKKNTESDVFCWISKRSWPHHKNVMLQIPTVDSYMTRPYLFVETKAKPGSANLYERIPWLPDMDEILADDWEVVI